MEALNFTIQVNMAVTEAASKYKGNLVSVVCSDEAGTPLCKNAWGVLELICKNWCS